MSIKSVMPSSHLILCRPLLLLPPIPPSIGVFSNESTLHMRWPKYWSFSFSISSSNKHPGLISFRMDWLDLLAIQGTLKSLLQLSALAPSFEKPLRHESEVEEEANAQAEAQKKKDEAEVQVNLYTHGSHRSRNKGSQRPGTLVQSVDCMPTI